MKIKDYYEKLMAEMEEIIILGTINGILIWDSETYMPPKGIDLRGKQLAFIAGQIHERMIDPKIAELIKAIKDSPDYSSLTNVEKRNVYLTQRQYDKSTKVPKKLVKQIAEQSAKTTQIWKKAKQEKDYSLYKPELEKILELTKKRAHYLDPEKHPFDVLLDEFEPGMTSEIISKLFDELKVGLVSILENCILSPFQPDGDIIKKKFPKKVQKKLSEDVARTLHYDLDRGSIDETVHPFTAGYYNDVRITTNYDEDNFSESFYTVIHECGHAIYEQNLDPKFMYQPVGSFCSLGIHESQSRIIENIIGRSPEFLEFYLPKLKEITTGIFSDIELDEFIKAINKVQPSKIRVTADEVTYCLHVIIRFEIEQDLLTGKITVNDLPKVWNAKYEEYLGVIIENDSEGVMQDSHWANGSFGYFPGYALGNIYNAQMLNTLKKDIPNFNELLKEGDFKPIINWLVEKVHKPSNLYDPPELIKRITGKEISPKYFIEYLEEKYSKIYKF
ncbi:MAG: carboxypeptidase M32 [Candidatus Hodarchaeota archaeon]